MLKSSDIQAVQLMRSWGEPQDDISAVMSRLRYLDRTKIAMERLTVGPKTVTHVE